MRSNVIIYLNFRSPVRSVRPRFPQIISDLMFDREEAAPPYVQMISLVYSSIACFIHFLARSLATGQGTRYVLTISRLHSVHSLQFCPCRH